MAGKTKQQHYQSIDRALAYIHANLTNELPLDLLAEKACYSKYHFCSIFMLHTGDSPMSYIQKQRILCAANELINTKNTILSIAIKYRFESQAAFSRAFKLQLNISPGNFRKEKKIVATKKPDREPSLLFDATTMSGELVVINEIKLAGMHTSTSFADNKIPALWQKFMPRVKEFTNISQKDVYYAVHPYESHLSIDDFSEAICVKRWACVPVSNFQSLPKDMYTHTLKGGKYLKYTYKGRAQDIFPFLKELYSHWIPTAGFELDERDDFEIIDTKRYFGPHHTNSEVDLFIPVK